jgi:tetratricopeptide (TPR) repeat protein
MITNKTYLMIMRKKSFILLCMLLIGSMANAQGVLEIVNISQPNDVYSTDGDGAAVKIRCHESIPLSFTSTMDKEVVPFYVELQGTDSVYYLAFPTGNRYRGRELSIYARGYTPVNLKIDLMPKQLLSYQITDPNALVDAGCYREHRNKGVLEIKNANYEEARNQFVVARDCSDVDQEENEKNIAMVDSLITYRSAADEAYKLLDYHNAAEYYTKVLALNPYDSFSLDRKNACLLTYSEECNTLFTKAEFYFTEKDYEKAKQLYEQVIAKECTNNIAIATSRLNTINSLATAKKDHARVFTYEWRKDSPIGFSYGNYNMHKVGGFFQMDFNPTIFDAIRGDCRYGDEKFPEFNVAFGWTIKIANPIWIHVGPGVTGKLYFGKYLDKCYPVVGYGESNLLDLKEMGPDVTLPKNDVPENYEDGWKKTNFAFGVSPVLGITAKYSYFAFRLTYQYRWSVQSKLQDFMGRNRLSLGVGVAF